MEVSEGREPELEDKEWHEVELEERSVKGEGVNHSSTNNDANSGQNLRGKIGQM